MTQKVEGKWKGQSKAKWDELDLHYFVEKTEMKKDPGKQEDKGGIVEWEAGLEMRGVLPNCKTTRLSRTSLRKFAVQCFPMNSKNSEDQDPRFGLSLEKMLQRFLLQGRKANFLQMENH